jgi:C_GCAxxG_C_C family probable redox protein
MTTNKPDQAVALFREGFSCSQAVFAAFSSEFGLDHETSLRLSQPFGGGMAHMGEVCGAVAGAFMIIGLKHGRTKAEDLEARDRTYSMMREFVLRFRGLHGAIRCPGLIGLDLGTEEGTRLAKEKNIFQTLCVKFVEDAAAIVEEIL